MTSPASATAAAGCALALLLTGSSGEDAARATGPTSGSGSDRDRDRDDSPLTPFFEALTSLEEACSEEALRTDAEEVIAACMREEGFDHTPREVVPTAGSLDEEAPAWNTLEHALEQAFVDAHQDELDLLLETCAGTVE